MEKTTDKNGRDIKVGDYVKVVNRITGLVEDYGMITKIEGNYIHLGKFGTYTMETKNSTKISTDKLGVFIERLKKIGIDVKLSGNFPWIYLNEICGKRVTETFQANHGFTVMFLPGRNDSPPSEFTDIKEIFNLIRKYTKK